METASEEEGTQRVLILKNSTCQTFDENGCETFDAQFVLLRNPKTDFGCLYIFSHDRKALYETLKFNEPYRSWFIDNSVQSDGSFSITTPVDPLFLVVPYLMKHTANVFQPLSQILVDDEFPHTTQLLDLPLSSLNRVADVKGTEEIQAYSFNKEKCLSWLKVKVEAAADRLEKTNENVGTGSSSASLVRSKKEQPCRADYVKYACGLVSDYIPPSLAADLKEYLGIKKEEQTKSREPPQKKAKLDVSEPTDDYSRGYKMEKESESASKKTRAQKLLSKVDKSGMKSISSFFAPAGKNNATKK